MFKEGMGSVIIKGLNAFGLVGPRENRFIASRLQIDHVGVGLYWPYHQHRHPSLTPEGSAEGPGEAVRVMHCRKNTGLLRHAETPRALFLLSFIRRKTSYKWPTYIL